MDKKHIGGHNNCLNFNAYSDGWNMDSKSVHVAIIYNECSLIEHHSRL